MGGKPARDHVLGTALRLPLVGQGSCAECGGILRGYREPLYAIRPPGEAKAAGGSMCTRGNTWLSTGQQWESIATKTIVLHF